MLSRSSTRIGHTSPFYSRHNVTCPYLLYVMGWIKPWSTGFKDLRKCLPCKISNIPRFFQSSTCHVTPTYLWSHLSTPTSFTSAAPVLSMSIFSRNTATQSELAQYHWSLFLPPLSFRWGGDLAANHSHETTQGCYKGHQKGMREMLSYKLYRVHSPSIRLFLGRVIPRPVAGANSCNLHELPFWGTLHDFATDADGVVSSDSAGI